MTARSSNTSPATHGAPPSQAEPTEARPRILIVDDNVDAATSLGRLLTLLGNETCIVHDGPSAVRKIAEFQPSVVLLDLGMPGMDGLETAQQIKAHPQGGSVTLIAVTGWGQECDRQRTLAAGFAAHLTKPVNVAQLESTLAKILQRHSSECRGE